MSAEGSTPRSTESWSHDPCGAPTTSSSPSRALRPTAPRQSSPLPNPLRVPPNTRPLHALDGPTSPLDGPRRPRSTDQESHLIPPGIPVEIGFYFIQGIVRVIVGGNLGLYFLEVRVEFSPGEVELGLS